MPEQGGRDSFYSDYNESYINILYNLTIGGMSGLKIFGLYDTLNQ